MAAPPPPPRRPIGVAILAILIILAGLVLTIIAVLALMAVLAVAPIPILIGIAAIFLILSLLLLAAGFGLWNLRPWAWWLAMIVLLLSIANQIAGVLAAGGFSRMGSGALISLAITGIVFLYLIAVRGSFRSSAYAR